LLSNLPAFQFTPRRIAGLYRQRWQIESLFHRLESVDPTEARDRACANRDTSGSR
jgi:IS4 transposase